MQLVLHICAEGLINDSYCHRENFVPFVSFVVTR